MKKMPKQIDLRRIRFQYDASIYFDEPVEHFPNFDLARKISDLIAKYVGKSGFEEPGTTLKMSRSKKRNKK